MSPAAPVSKACNALPSRAGCVAFAAALAFVIQVGAAVQPAPPS